ncbi:hypothetical protein EV356DRAFT_536667 [Viridothelium virens]|uniref:Uncharacterized protein n=1 Tax=Viridothelium virens TaxID=1048519 RepID=A0A6A6GWW5_VIRVR|nr:hypothetical protein EV356DRAFT_536667 [Viridothelium virens]
MVPATPTISDTTADEDESVLDTGNAEVLHEPRFYYCHGSWENVKQYLRRPWCMESEWSSAQWWILFRGLRVDLWKVDLNSEKAPTDYFVSEDFKWELEEASTNDIYKAYPRTTNWITDQGDWQCPASDITRQVYLLKLLTIIEDLIQKHKFTEENFVNPEFASEAYLAREAICMFFVRLSECWYSWDNSNVYEQRCFLAHSYGKYTHTDNGHFVHHFRTIWKLISKDFVPKKTIYNEVIQNFVREALAEGFEEE